MVLPNFLVFTISFVKKIHTYIKNVLNLKTFWSWGDTERRLALVTIIRKAGSEYVILLTSLVLGGRDNYMFLVFEYV